MVSIPNDTADPCGPASTTHYEQRGTDLLPGSSQADPSAYQIAETRVDDEIARVTWKAYAIQRERREDLDYTEETDDGVIEYHAYRQTPRRSTAHLIVRKTDGVVLTLIELPEGDDHDQLRELVSTTATSILAPLVPSVVSIEPMIRSMDEGAVRGGRQTRDVTLDVAPTQARYATDGARLEFRSTRESQGYIDSTPTRQVRRAMQIASFAGEAGKFLLTFDDADARSHQMIISLNASKQRIYLFARMSETEVLALVDQLIALR